MKNACQIDLHYPFGIYLFIQRVKSIWVYICFLNSFLDTYAVGPIFSRSSTDHFDNLWIIKLKYIKNIFGSILAYALRDGVLLCHVASTICPEAIDQRNVNQRPQFAQFLCLKNIRVFLTACRDGFNLAETDLFQPGIR